MVCKKNGRWKVQSVSDWLSNQLCLLFWIPSPPCDTITDTVDVVGRKKYGEAGKKKGRAKRGSKAVCESSTRTSDELEKKGRPQCRITKACIMH